MPRPSLFRPRPSPRAALRRFVRRRQPARPARRRAVPRPLVLRRQGERPLRGAAARPTLWLRPQRERFPQRRGALRRPSPRQRPLRRAAPRRVRNPGGLVGRLPLVPHLGFGRGESRFDRGEPLFGRLGVGGGLGSPALFGLARADSSSRGVRDHPSLVGRPRIDGHFRALGKSSRVFPLRGRAFEVLRQAVRRTPPERNLPSPFCLCAALTVCRAILHPMLPAWESRASARVRRRCPARVIDSSEPSRLAATAAGGSGSDLVRDSRAPGAHAPQIPPTRVLPRARAQLT